MEALLSQFTLLSDLACQDKNFDPSSIDDLMKLFEIEAYKSWAEMELEQEKEVKQAEVAMEQAEYDLDLVMESAMDEFRRFEVEMERMARNELENLEKTAESARKMGNLMEKAATIASKKYMEAALNSATASMKKALKGLSTKKESTTSTVNMATRMTERQIMRFMVPVSQVGKTLGLYNNLARHSLMDFEEWF